MTDRELPEGWAETTLADITVRVPNVKPENEPNREFGYIDISSVDRALATVNEKEIRRFYGKDAPSRAKRPVQTGDILFSNVRTNLRNVAIIHYGLDASLCSTGFTVLRTNGAMLPELLLRWVLTDAFTDTVTDTQTGTHYPATSDSQVLTQTAIVPPLAEQRRIVEKIEALLADANTARERLAKVPRILKRFRQAVLAAACSGRLTEEWRECGLQQLEQTTIGAVAECVGGYAYKSPTFTEKGNHQVIRIGNVKPFRLELKVSPVFISEGIARETSRFSLQKDDIVISMTGTKYKKDYGFAAKVNESDGSLFLNQRVTRLRCIESLLPVYLLLWLQTETFREFFFSCETGNVNQGNVGVTGIKDAPIFIPPLPEQTEIVRRVEGLFALADTIEQRVAAAAARADRVPQAILAKAFKGELVPTEAELARAEGRGFESAAELLARVKAARESEGAPIKGRKGGTRTTRGEKK